MSAPNELSFLPEDYLEKKVIRRANILCVLLLLLGGGGIAICYSWTRADSAKIDANFAEVDSRYLDAARKIEQVKKMHEKQRAVFHHAELAASLVEKVPRSNILAEVTNSLPTGVSLIDFIMHSSPHQVDTSTANTAFAQQRAQLDAKNSADSAKPPQRDVKLTITGIARDDVQVAQLMTHLDHSTLFSAVNLVISDTYNDQRGDQPKNDKAPQLRRWQIEMMLSPTAEVKEATRTAAMELNK
jgi:Tfp pilus assembly protein PilN